MNMARTLLSATAVLCALCATATAKDRTEGALQPHIVHILMDDLGWAEVGYHNTLARQTGDISTPNLDKLAATGLELDRFYAEKICSPSRCSLQSGRFGVHVNVQNVFPEVTNLADPVGGYQGMPVNMTGVAEVLRDHGYTTRMVGKWDVGMATTHHSPEARGYTEWLGYWHHSNDYWSFVEETCEGEEGKEGGGRVEVRDLWRGGPGGAGPAKEYQNCDACSQEDQFPAAEGGEGGDGECVCVYEEDILYQEVLGVIAAHPPARPLFLFYSMHLVHMPLQAQQAALDAFSAVDNTHRQQMHAMVNAMDAYIGGVVHALQTAGLWNNTLLVVHGDNGGEVLTEFCGGNNWPLRGGKFSHFEGGVRVPALVSGGALPAAQRGAVSESLMSIADWYATYAYLAGAGEGAGLVDERAAAAGLPPLDSKNCWAMLSGAAVGAGACRSEVVLGDTSAVAYNMDGDALVGGLLREDYHKLLLGPANQGYMVGQDVLTGPLYPNNSLPVVIPALQPRVCGRTPATGCLFNVHSDPSESSNLAATMPELFTEMLARVDALQASVYSPVRGHKDPAACASAADRGYYWGPFLAPSF